jgi:hypothetical protein
MPAQEARIFDELVLAVQKFLTGVKWNHWPKMARQPWMDFPFSDKNQVH